MKDHLIPCNIVRILDKFREYEDTFSFKLLQCLVSNLARKICYFGEDILPLSKIKGISALRECPFSMPKISEGGNAMPKKAPEKIGSVLRVPLSQLHPHPQNPFAVRDDPAMQELKESVSQNGVLVPAIARPRAEGGYELIAGHRRKYACEQAGQDSMPVIVLNLNDDEAVIQLVDSNIQREDILPSERARAYKMKMDAIKRQGARTDLTSPNGSAKFRSDDLIGEKDGVSGDTVRNYIN